MGPPQEGCAFEARPLHIDVDRMRCVRIRWADGHESTFPLSLLRRSCPCAVCRDAREQAARSPLRVVPGGASEQEMVTIRTAELVGHYALRITWRDGHDSGIFDYELLRGLCPCEHCSARVSGP